MSRALSRAISRDVDSFRVDVPWQALNKLQPLRGNLIDVLGAPGVGKSAFALNWALKVATPSAIISLDTDLTTQAVRAAAILSDNTTDAIKETLPKWGSFLDKAAYKVRAYDLGYSPREILDVISAESEFWGDSPSLVIVDNISNLVQDGGYEEYRKVFLDLHRVARTANTCVVVCHHIGRDSARRTTGSVKVPPISLWSGQYSGEQESEIVLGLWNGGDDKLNVSILKNRTGEADPQGELYVKLKFDKSKMIVDDLTENELLIDTMKGTE